MEELLKKNDDITLEITGVTSEGSGVGRFSGFAVFVPFALAGETVEAHIIKVTPSYAVGKLTKIIVPSPFRVEPLCPVFGKCGGCVLQNMSYPAQLEYKRQQVVDALERIGGFKGIEVNPTVGAEKVERYRNKGSFPFAMQDGEPVWGLYAQRSHRLIETPDCIIENETAINAANAVKLWAKKYSVPAYDENSCRGVLRHVVTRSQTGGATVCVVTTGELPRKKELTELIREAVPDVRSIIHNINKRDTNVICGEENRLIWGEGSVSHILCGCEYKVSQESFLQVNTEQTEKLYRLVVDGLGLKGKETVADVFCGIGTITLLLARKAVRAVGIEYVPKAIEDAKRNAEINGISNAEFFCGAAEKVLPHLVGSGMRFDCVVLDPPRKGADPLVLEAIASSEANRIAYISCNPATLARDLKILHARGYRIESVTPVDMFPMTNHVETVCCLYYQRKTSFPYRMNRKMRAI